MHALIADLRSKINPLYAATEGTESYERRLCAEALEQLIAERDALALQVAQMRSVLNKAASDYRSIAHYDDAAYQILFGCYEEVDEALALPDLSAEVIKRHDAGVLRKAAEQLHVKARAYPNECDRSVAHDMAAAIGDTK